MVNVEKRIRQASKYVASLFATEQMPFKYRSRTAADTMPAFVKVLEDSDPLHRTYDWVELEVPTNTLVFSGDYPMFAILHEVTHGYHRANNQSLQQAQDTYFNVSLNNLMNNPDDVEAVEKASQAVISGIIGTLATEAVSYGFDRYQLKSMHPGKEPQITGVLLKSEKEDPDEAKKEMMKQLEVEQDIDGYFDIKSIVGSFYMGIGHGRVTRAIASAYSTGRGFGSSIFDQRSAEPQIESKSGRREKGWKFMVKLAYPEVSEVEALRKLRDYFHMDVAELTRLAIKDQHDKHLIVKQVLEETELTEE
jgi:hypothetical protein